VKKGNKKLRMTLPKHRETITPTVLEFGMERKTDKASRKMRLGSLKNGNPSGDFTKAPRCGATTRRGTSCQAPVMPNGRCRLHGGLSTGPKTAEGIDRIRKALTKHGRYSAATKLRRERYWQVLLGPHFKGKLELLDSLREPTGAEKPHTQRPRGS
jgi:hypothetical protein